MVGPLVTARGDAIELHLPDIARYKVDRHGLVSISPEPQASDLDLSCFERGPVAALSLLQQGFFPLRAAAVCLRPADPLPTGILIAGGSATGKSVTTAMLAQRGAAVLADKVATAATSGDELLLVAVPNGGTELWPPMAAVLGLDPEAGATVRPGLAKRSFGLGTTPSPTAPPRVELLVILDVDNRLDAPRSYEIRHGRHKLHALLGVQWHRRLIGPLGLGGRHLEWAANLASRLKMVRVIRPRHGMSVNGVTALIEDAAAPGSGHHRR